MRAGIISILSAMFWCLSAGLIEIWIRFIVNSILWRFCSGSFCSRILIRAFLPWILSGLFLAPRISSCRILLAGISTCGCARVIGEPSCRCLQHRRYHRLRLRPVRRCLLVREKCLSFCLWSPIDRALFAVLADCCRK